jgi:hypothetical protein
MRRSAAIQSKPLDLKPLPRDVLSAKIDVQIAKLRLLAAWTAVALHDPRRPWPRHLDDEEPDYGG